MPAPERPEESGSDTAPPGADSRTRREAPPKSLTGGSQAFFRREERERPQPAPGLTPGKVVGDFRLVALIGQGGMGQVWEAEQVSLQRAVAVSSCGLSA